MILSKKKSIKREKTNFYRSKGGIGTIRFRHHFCHIVCIHRITAFENELFTLIEKTKWISSKKSSNSSQGKIMMCYFLMLHKYSLLHHVQYYNRLLKDTGDNGHGNQCENYYSWKLSIRKKELVRTDIQSSQCGVHFQSIRNVMWKFIANIAVILMWQTKQLGK